ncbi:MAG: flagellar assembly protein FliH [Candidatus Latescibacterota bacterium]
MSKVIRTARFAGPSVTVGEAERDLYVGINEKKNEKSLESLGIAALLEADMETVQRELNAEWESKMQQEVSYVRGEGEKRLQEAEAAWQGERETLNQQRYDEGLEEGLAQRETEAQDAVKRMEVLHQSLVAERVQVLVEAEVAVVDLAVALARRIIGIQAVANPKVLIQVARAALEHLSEASNLEIKVHPDDLAVARRFAAHWVKKVDQDAVFKVRSSAHVGRGGCMIEGLEENVDARLDEQLKIMHQTLRDAVLGQEHDEREKALAQIEGEKSDE